MSFYSFLFNNKIGNKIINIYQKASYILCLFILERNTSVGLDLQEDEEWLGLDVEKVAKKLTFL